VLICRTSGGRTRGTTDGGKSCCGVAAMRVTVPGLSGLPESLSAAFLVVIGGSVWIGGGDAVPAVEDSGGMGGGETCGGFLRGCG
jgi:hypothetical protein